MMGSVFLLLLLLLWVDLSLAVPQCERSSTVRVSVSSWRNQTGHRLVVAEMRSDVSLEDAVSLSVDQWTERCGPAGTVALSMTASSARPPVSGATLVPVSPDNPVTPRPPPRPDYHHIPGMGYYKHHNYQSMTWIEARRTCESEGAHLAVFESRGELEALFNFTNCCPWIGIHRQGPSSPWITTLGQSLSASGFKGWLEGYPKGPGNCTRFDFDISGRGISNDLCTNTHAVLCEQQVDL